MDLDLKFEDSFIILKKSDVVYVFSSYDSDPHTQSHYQLVTGQSSLVVYYAYENSRNFSFENLYQSSGVDRDKALSVLKSLIEMGIIKPPSNFPKNIKPYYSEFEKVLIEPLDQSIVANSDNGYKDIYDPFVRLT